MFYLADGWSSATVKECMVREIANKGGLSRVETVPLMALCQVLNHEFIKRPWGLVTAEVVSNID